MKSTKGKSLYKSLKFLKARKFKFREECASVFAFQEVNKIK